MIPIVNENDTVAVEEIRMGDNDVLSSLVAAMVQAQLLIILSDVAGVLTGDPRKRPDARLIPLITDPEAEMRGLVAESAGPLGSGGMATKLKAAQQAARAGIAVIIAPGRAEHALAAALDPARECGTLILPTRTRLKSRKHWIAFALRPAGALTVDRGAAEALRKKGRSLLPSGIREVARRVRERRLREPARSRGRRVRPRAGQLSRRRCTEGEGPALQRYLAHCSATRSPTRSSIATTSCCSKNWHEPWHESLT